LALPRERERGGGEGERERAKIKTDDRGDERTGQPEGSRDARGMQEGVGTAAEKEEKKARKENRGGGRGRFYEVDAALVCDELAACLVNSTLSLSLFSLALYCSSFL